MLHLDDGTLQAWLDRPRSGLTASEREEVESHLAVCEACGRRLVEMDELSGRVDALLSVPAPLDEPIPSYEAVVARAHRHRGTRRRRFRWTAGAWAASVVLALGAGWMAHGLYRRPTVPSVSRVLQPASGTVRPDASAPVPPVAAAKGTPDASAHDTASKPAPHAPESDAAKAASPSTAPHVAETTFGSDVVSPDTSAALVRGRVTDDRGRPLASAQVSVEGTGAGALTRPDGTFSISLDSVTADSTGRPITLNAALIGYARGTQKLTVRPGRVASTDIRLEPQAVSMNEIMVTGISGSAAPRTPTASRAQPSPQAYRADTLRIEPVPVAPSDSTGHASSASASRAQAEAFIGFPLLTVPDLLVTRIDEGMISRVPVVRVHQALGGGGALELVEAGYPLGCAIASSAGGRTCVTVQRDRIFVVGIATVSSEALHALLARLK
jgi:CarboxypepD_reg-like domain/Putative zinc-finger